VHRFTRHDLGLVAVALIWGANYSITKQALAHIAPVAFAAIRFVLSSVLLVGVARWLDGGGTVSAEARRRLLALGVLGHTLNQIAFVGALSLTTATNTALIFASLPMVVAVMGVALGVERPHPRVWAGIGVGTLGVIILVGARGVRFSAATFQGDLLAVVGMILWAGFTVGLRWATRGVGSIRATMLTHLGGTPGLVAAAVPFSDGVGAAVRLPAVWGAVLYSAIFSSAVAAVLWTRGVKVLGGNRTALYNCLTPVFAGAIAWFVLGERPVPVQGLGAALVIAAVVLSRTPAPDPES
jgi:drug/metabolite transporter (DMT)-like permease